MSANLENSVVTTGLEKVSFHFNPKERQCQRMFIYHTITHISPANKVMLKILQARLQQYVSLQMFKLDLEKAEKPEIQLPTSVGSLIKLENPEKNLLLLYRLMPKSLTVWITTNCGKFLEMKISDHLICLLKYLYAGQEATVRTGHGTTDWF